MCQFCDDRLQRLRRKTIENEMCDDQVIEAIGQRPVFNRRANEANSPDRVGMVPRQPLAREIQHGSAGIHAIYLSPLRISQQLEEKTSVPLTHNQHAFGCRRFADKEGSRSL